MEHHSAEMYSPKIETRPNTSTLFVRSRRQPVLGISSARTDPSLTNATKERNTGHIVHILDQSPKECLFFTYVCSHANNICRSTMLCADLHSDKSFMLVQHRVSALEECTISSKGRYEVVDLVFHV